MGLLKWLKKGLGRFLVINSRVFYFVEILLEQFNIFGGICSVFGFHEIYSHIPNDFTFGYG